MKREDVKDSRKWDLSSLVNDDKEFDKLISIVQKGIEELKTFEGKLTPDNSLECLKLQSNTSRAFERLYLFSFMSLDEDTANNISQERAEKIKMLTVDYTEATSFVNVEISNFDVEVLQSMQQAKDFEAFSTILKSIIRNKKHFLSPIEEKLLASMQSFSVEFKNIFTMFNNADIKFDDVEDENGEKIKMSHGTYALLLQNNLQRVRRDAFNSNYKAFESMINTLTANYSGNVKKNCMIAKARKFKSALDQELYGEVVDVKVYNALINNVKGSQHLVHKYVALRKKALGLDELHMYDMYVPLVKEIELKLDYDKAYSLVREALKPLGEEYISLLDEAKESRWIDVEETENKRSGAYSWSTYDAHPFVLLNYKETPHDIFTIAHEMGHALHSYYSHKSQCYEKASYEIILAEIASTVNEVLVLKHLIKSAEGDNKKFLLSYYLDMFRTTIFRQTMFAEFEKFAHQTIEEGKPITKEVLNNYYYNLNLEYYGDAVEHDDYIKLEWARIPHFYTAFYVYKYATGLTTAVSVARRILNDKSGEMLKKYKNFLSAGGSMDPLDILSLVDIDLKTDKPYEDAFSEFAETLNELEGLL